MVLRVILPFGMLLSAFLTAFFRLQGIKQVADASRAASKRYGKPTMMKLAGRRYFFAGIVRDSGRRSGRKYATPVWAVPTSEGFLISLPFGEEVDWLKNVLAAGRATIETKGDSWEVVEPELVDREVAHPLLPWWVRLMFDLVGFERYVKVKRLSVSPSATAGETHTTADTHAYAGRSELRPLIGVGSRLCTLAIQFGE